MAVVALLFVFLLLVFVGVPIVTSLGFSSLLFLYFYLDVNLVIMVQRIFTGIDSFTLMAIPFFAIAGSAMNYGGITQRIVAFSNAIVGSFRGGLAMVNVFASMLFGGISGSAVADTSAIGGVLIPAMKDEKYSPEFSASVTAFSSGLGPIIPPSISMVVYGVITGTSITKLFLGGALPGLAFGVALLAITFIISIRRQYPKHDRVSFAELLKTLRRVFWALLMPVIIVGGILTGIFTVTEAAAVAAVYSLAVGAFVYKEINSLQKLYEIFVASAMIVGSIMILIGAAKLYSWLLVVLDVPQLLVSFIQDFTNSPVVVLLLINVFMLIIGMFIECNAALILFVPILIPLVQSYNIDLVHLGIILVVNLSLGLVTPPVGLTITLASKIARVPVLKTILDSGLFFLVSLGILLLVTYVPDFVLFLPSLVRF